MGTKRVGLARIEALMENLKREIKFGAGTSLAGARKVVSSHNNDLAVSITMTEADYASGTLFSLDMNASTNDISFTLPALTAGLEYEFMVQTTAGSGVTLTIAGPSAALEATAVCSDGIEVSTGQTFLVAATKAVAGSHIRAVCDGTRWLLLANLPGAAKSEVAAT